MPDLERDLYDLAPHLDFPETPDVAARVVARLPARPPRRPSLRRRVAAAVSLALLVAAGTVLAVPPARRAVGDLLGIRGASVTRVDRLPAVPPARPLHLGEALPLDRAAARAGLPALVPRELGPPDRAYVQGVGGRATLALVWSPRDGLSRTRETGVGLLVLEARGAGEIEFAKKFAGPGTTVERVDVDGAPAIWLSGAPHVVAIGPRGGRIRVEPARLAGNTLLWNRGGLVVRMESRLSRDQAVRVAESIP